MDSKIYSGYKVNYLLNDRNVGATTSLKISWESLGSSREHNLKMKGISFNSDGSTNNMS
jgi:hypothetical protein